MTRLLLEGWGVLVRGLCSTDLVNRSVTRLYTTKFRASSWESAKCTAQLVWISIYLWLLLSPQVACPSSSSSSAWSWGHTKLNRALKWSTAASSSAFLHRRFFNSRATAERGATVGQRAPPTQTRKELRIQRRIKGPSAVWPVASTADNGLQLPINAVQLQMKNHGLSWISITFKLQGEAFKPAPCRVKFASKCGHHLKIRYQAVGCYDEGDSFEIIAWSS